MSTAIVYARARLGMEAPEVAVEIHMSTGIPSFTIVGLPQAAVRESRDRVRGALMASQFEFPRKRIIANLAPADLPKEGGRFDLAIAIGVLIASGQLHSPHLRKVELLGELGLSGAIRSVPGVLPAALAAGAAGRAVVIPRDDQLQAGLARRVRIYPMQHLLEACDILSRDELPESAAPRRIPATPPSDLSLDDVRGQQGPKRALVIAAAGGHNLLMNGPPGTGKSMLARRLPTLLPPLSEREALEVASIYSVAGQGARALDHTPPFRDPHHSASAAAIVGGGSIPQPGEISLAHRGVLFLDEIPEFSRNVLEVLREPLEVGETLIVRAHARVRYPARFQLVAAMNPCPAGRACQPQDCSCSLDAQRRYRARLSAPLLDRIDLFVDVDPIEPALLRTPASGEARAAATQVRAARERQHDRAGVINRDLRGGALAQACPLESGAEALLDHAVKRLGLSMRGYHRTLRVARTIADLENSDVIRRCHLAEALGYRRHQLGHGEGG